MENREKSELLESAIKATEISTREGIIKQQKLKLSLREKDIEQGVVGAYRVEKEEDIER